ncbi:helix-turn-helix domain-containing protein [Brachybacterium sp. AOP43-C2-M15]|uniref:helix-turn-helix domain-containing protein n=1 Tax=Brachybacterium sp. AOP43-C2-M15 TaxID=3457661 RepID=UPI004033A50F
MSSGTKDGDAGATHSGKDDFATRDQLRAMAHPLRLEIMERVGRRGTARAADVAADLGIPANSVSYHLRILARGGVVEEAPEAARDRRDRVWRLTQLSFEHGRRTGGPDNDPEATDVEYLDASGATSLAAFEWIRSAWNAEIARYRSRDIAPEDGLGSLFATSLRLSKEQMRELNRTINAALHEYQLINRDELGANLPGDPESDQEAYTFKVLWAAVGELSPQQERSRERRESGDGATDGGEAPGSQPSDGSSTASPSSRA